ncbi:MAG TPA: helix-turn-helix domain-containing protein [Ignavibacteria bacterium]
MKLYIKHMVSNRCKMSVNEMFKKLGLHVLKVELGEVDVSDFIPEDHLVLIRNELLDIGFELLEDKQVFLIEKIKNSVIEMIHHSDEMIKVNFSDYLREKLNYDYSYLSNRFSEEQGITIEHFIILHKIERIRELIIYDELNISEIAHKMNYSSAAHLSGQFKKVKGMTPTSFKKLKLKKGN